MRLSILLAIFLISYASMAMAANVVRQTMAIENNANPRVACQNPKFGFSSRELESCISVYQGCQRPDLNQAERDKCIIDAVRKGVSAPGPAAGQKGDASKGPRNLDFSFNPFQAADLIEVCEQKQNKSRPLCAGAVLPNKARIISDINKAWQ